MTIKVYDSKVYGKTVYMRYGTIEDERCTYGSLRRVYDKYRTPFVPNRSVPHVNGFLVISYTLLSSSSGDALSYTFWGTLKYLL